MAKIFIIEGYSLDAIEMYFEDLKSENELIHKPAFKILHKIFFPEYEMLKGKDERLDSIEKDLIRLVTEQNIKKMRAL